MFLFSLRQQHSKTVPSQVNGAEYQGQWKEGRFHDDGELRLADGTSYVPQR